MCIAIKYDSDSVLKYNVSDSDVNRVKKLVAAVVEEIGDVLDIHNDRYINVRFNASKRTWGMMQGEYARLPKKYIGALAGTLTLNNILLTIDEFWLKNVIMHELLHMNPGCHGHTGLWKVYAEKVNNALGYKIQRCTSAQEMGIKDIEGYKYGIECTTCHSKDRFINKCKVVKFPHLYHCTVCGGSFKSYALDGSDI